MPSYMSAFCEVEIEKGGVTYCRDPNSSGFGASGNRKGFPVFFNSISSVRADVKMAELSLIELTLTPTFEDAMAILSSGLIGMGVSKPEETPDASSQGRSPASLSGGTGAAASLSGASGASDALVKPLANLAVLRVRFLRPDEEGGSESTPWFVGSLTQPNVQMSGLDVTITLKGYASAVVMSGPNLNVEIKEDLSAMQLVEDLLQTINWDLEFEDDESEAAMASKYFDPQVKTGQPMRTIKWAVESCGCVMVPGYNETTKREYLSVKKQAAIFKQTPALSFIYLRNFESGAEPPEVLVSDFSMDGGVAWFMNGFAFGGYKLGQDQFKKQFIVEPIEVEDSKQSGISTQPKASAESTQYPGYISRVQDANPKTDGSSLQSSKQVTNLNNFQKITLNAFGAPGLSPTKIVNLKVGDVQAFSVVLMVIGVVHTWDSNGWNMQIEGRITGGLDSIAPADKIAVSNQAAGASGGLRPTRLA